MASSLVTRFLGGFVVFTLVLALYIFHCVLLILALIFYLNSTFLYLCFVYLLYSTEESKFYFI